MACVIEIEMTRERGQQMAVARVGQIFIGTPCILLLNIFIIHINI